MSVPLCRRSLVTDTSMNPLRGILLKVGAVVLFGMMAALIKAAMVRIPSGEAVFFRAVLGIPVIFVWLGVQGKLAGAVRVVSPLGHVIRGMLGALSMVLGFTAYRFLPLPEAQSIAFLTPVLVVVFAAIILGERVRFVRAGAVAMGLIGVVIVIWPRLSGFSGPETDDTATIGVVAALLAAICAAFAQVTIRRMVGVERTSAIVFWFSVTSAGFALLTLPFGWLVPTPFETLLLVGAGLCGGTGQIMVTAAYRHADVALIAPFDYFSILVAIVLGYVFFGEVATLNTLAGAAIVIAAGIVIIWREHSLGLKREAQRKASTPNG